MSTVLYSVTSRKLLFNGERNVEGMHKGSDCWYEGDDRKKSLDLARKYSDDTVEVNKSGILREVYQWSALEFNDCDEIVGWEVKTFDPLDRFKRTKKIAKYAHLFSRHGYDLISYIVGKRKLIGEFMHGNHVCYLYRYEDTAFGDFTAYEDRGLWLPENFCDYGILKPDELMLAMDEGVTFWQDWQTNDRDERLFYKIFQNN